MSLFQNLKYLDNIFLTSTSFHLKILAALFFIATLACVAEVICNSCSTYFKPYSKREIFIEINIYIRYFFWKYLSLPDKGIQAFQKHRTTFMPQAARIHLLVHQVFGKQQKEKIYLLIRIKSMFCDLPISAWHHSRSILDI